MRTFFTFFLFINYAAINAQAPHADPLKYCVQNDVGIGGYDPVSYFQADKPQKGMKLNEASYDGVSYYFVSAANRKTFTKDPQKYIPQFGGWCSMTLAMGRATQPTFDNFLIDSGRLYLFERTLSVNGKELWLKDVKKNQQLASDNYHNLIINRKKK
jgi:YHS domain-containing protein